MTDPLIGSIYNARAMLQVRDLPESPAADPRVELRIDDRAVALSLADISKALSILKQAQELLTERKGNAFLERNFELPF